MYASCERGMKAMKRSIIITDVVMVLHLLYHIIFL